jgi:hypothetical protein
MRFTVLALMLVISFGATARSQSPQQINSTPACSFSEIFRKEGWTVPGRDGAKPKSKRAELGGQPGVFVTRLEPAQAEADLTELWCPPDHPGRIEVDQMPIKIVDLWSYDLDGSVFAYRLLYARERLDADGTREDTGMVIAVYLYDVVGSGKFTTMIGAKQGVGYFVPSFMPDWIKSRAATRSR